MPSDEFFANRAAASDRTPYDLVFIDGLHVADQVERDIVNSLLNLAPAGTIVLHDCNPTTESARPTPTSTGSTGMGRSGRHG